VRTSSLATVVTEPHFPICAHMNGFRLLPSYKCDLHSSGILHSLQLLDPRRLDRQSVLKCRGLSVSTTQYPLRVMTLCALVINNIVITITVSCGNAVVTAVVVTSCNSSSIQGLFSILSVSLLYE
jgi:hypothetical protein